MNAILGTVITRFRQTRLLHGICWDAEFDAEVFYADGSKQAFARARLHREAWSRWTLKIPDAPADADTWARLKSDAIHMATKGERAA